MLRLGLREREQQSESWGLEARLEAQLQAHALRVAFALLGRLHRPLRSPVLDGPHHRLQHLELRNRSSFVADVSEIQTFEHDVVVIGAGGAGLRAAIESSKLGMKT